MWDLLNSWTERRTTIDFLKRGTKRKDKKEIKTNKEKINNFCVWKYIIMYY